ncbi:MAG: hypothetical protein KF833_16555 [Verrucomicrobiae bacterium]|nr:hypothetical protein [Verrucomicrobiae bacterium]
MKPASLEAARAAKVAALAALGSLGGLAGIGITRAGSGYALKVNLSEPPSPEGSVPEEFDGVPVTVEIVGPVRKR